MILIIKAKADFMMGGAFVTNVAEKLQEICKKKIDTEVKIRYTYIRWCKFISNSKFNICIMREWLSGGAPPCQGGGSRVRSPSRALFIFREAGSLSASINPIPRFS